MSLVNQMDARQVFDELVGDIPEDITLLMPDQLRNAHAYWTASHNYSSSRLADIQARIKAKAREREVRFKTKYLEFKTRLRLSNEMARYKAEMTKKVSRLDDDLAAMKMLEIKWAALMQQCDSFKKLCSRDQSYREEEIRTYYGRGGTGK